MTAGVDSSTALAPPEPRRRRHLPRPHGVQIFASTSEAPRARRPTDGVLLVACILLLIVMMIIGGLTTAEGGLVNIATHLPGSLTGLWQILHDLAVVWAAGLILVALVARHRLFLVRDLILAALLATALTALAFHTVEGTWPSFGLELSSGARPHFPAIQLAIAAAVIVTASPHLGRPLRYAGRWIATSAALATLCLGLSTPGGVAGGLIIGTIAAAIVHLAFGSPGGRPSLRRVGESLSELGMEVTDLAEADLQPEGVWTVRAVDADGQPLTVKVYGRDAWDGQLSTSVWRFLWYRNQGRAPSVSRIQQVEHEAFMNLLAARGGVRVPVVLAAGRADSGDALLAIRSTPLRLDDVRAPSDELIAELWTMLGLAHDRGLTPGQIDPSRIGIDDDAQPVFLDWVSGETSPTGDLERQVGAQLLVTTGLAVGAERAIATARASLGDNGLADLLPHLQPASLSPTLRAMAHDRGFDVKALRKATAAALDAQVPDLVQIRRVTPGTILQAALLVLASAAIIQGLTSLDWASVSDEVRNMSLAAVVAGFILAQIARASGAFSTMGAAPGDVPLMPTVQLHFAMAYINMAVPSSAGRLALVMRFFQRLGQPPATAIGVSALDSFANFFVQIVLVLITLVFGLGSLQFDLTSSTSDLTSTAAKFLVLIIIGLVVGAAVAVLVPSVRKRVLPTLRQFRDGLKVLHSPKKVAMLLGGNLASQTFYSLALGACAYATGYKVGLADLLLITNVVCTLSSLIPVPNGIGVSEAGLTAGLMAAGVPQEAAFAAAIVYRTLSSYIPPFYGFAAMRDLQKRDFL